MAGLELNKYITDFSNSVNGGLRKITDTRNEYIDSSLKYMDKVGDGARIRFNQAIDSPYETLKDTGLGVLNSAPSTVSGLGDLLGYETPASDSATQYLRGKMTDKNSLGFDMGEVVGMGGLLTKPAIKIAKVGGNMMERAARAKHIKKFVGKDIKTTEAISDAFRGGGKETANTIFESKIPVKSTPTYREVNGLIDDGNAYGVHISSSKPNIHNNIYVAGQETLPVIGKPNAKGMSRLSMQNFARSSATKNSTKLHEFDHEYWTKKYGGFGKENNPLVAQTRGKTSDLVKDAEWSSKPWEINAQAKQIQNELNILTKNSDDIAAYSRLEELVQNTSPFVDEFTKKYPDELGGQILKGMDYLDNTIRYPAKIPFNHAQNISNIKI